ncbi:MAG: tRNA-dihydrouridine synthase family protein [Spirochaetia bacterium]|nr:tRNA-dihydrouridine synthase family protein [Spirochaetia bacterium]
MFGSERIKIKGKIALSPMAGVSDSPTRQITRKMGSAFSFTEFVSTDGIKKGIQKTIDLFKFQEMERPIHFQIFGNKKNIITDACKIIEELNPDVIDLNMGCSVSKVAHKGSGAGLLRDPIYAGEIIYSMSKNVKIPITAKIRIGWDHKSLNYKEVVHILQESGISMLSVHGRTKMMGYTGRADWNIIGEIKSFAKVPVWGNGDITTFREANQKILETGVDGVLVGRGAIGNPWIFSGVDKETLDFNIIREKIVEHLQLMQDFYGEEGGLILFRKHFVRYLHGVRGILPLKERLLTETNPDRFMEILMSYIPNLSEEIFEINQDLDCSTHSQKEAILS